MPIYEYSCESCDTTFEVLTKKTGPLPELFCPSCGQSKSKKLHKLPGSAGNIRMSLSASASTSNACTGNYASCDCRFE